MTRVVALLACHNRKDRTLACLDSLFAQDTEGVEVRAVLIDDGSTDGTSDVVRSSFEQVEVIQADGSLYWASSMALAESHAVRRRPEFLLWLNDDVTLYPSALKTLLATTDPHGGQRIVVGYTVDPATDQPSYGGASRVDWHPLRYQLVVPTDGRATNSDTFNGNVVLVPHAIFDAVGGIDGGFAHAFADLDYGLRARALGFEVVVATPAVGECARNVEAPWRDTSLSLVARYRLMSGRKGVPISSSVRYLRRHGGTFWPLYIVATYAKVATGHLRARFARGRDADPARRRPSPAANDDHESNRDAPVRPQHALEQRNWDL